MAKKILLTAINAKYIHSNLAIYSLRANAGKYEELVELAEYTINHRPDEILEGIYKREPDVVGFSCYIWNIESVLCVAENLKKVLPHVMIVLGGPEVSYDAKQVLEQHRYIDFIMIGEGEHTFREFLGCYAEGKMEELATVCGLCFRQMGKCIVTPPRMPADMDELCFPYRSVTDMENRIIYYETIRGCPFSCSYCLSSVEKSVRFRKCSTVFEELSFFLGNKVRQVKFVDRTFNCDHEHAYQIWNYIYEHDNGITNFHFEIGGDLLREEDFELFRKFRPGLVQFEIGVQSANKETIKAIRRKMDLPVLKDHIERVRQTGKIHQHLDLIAGLPYEDYESFHNSFNEVYGMKPDQLQLGFLKLLKGSYMQEMCGEYGIKYGSRPPYEVLCTKWLSYADLLKLKQVEEMVEVYYNSFQFRATMALLENCGKDAFRMYEDLGKYYEKNGYFGKKHSRIARYEILWEYVTERYAGLKEELRQTLTYDLYLRDYVKSPPEFVKKREEDYLASVRTFLDREAAEPEILSEYRGYVPRQLFHMVYVDEFTLDFETLLTQGRAEKGKAYSLVFDYKKRNPLSHSARVARVLF